MKKQSETKTDKKEKTIKDVTLHPKTKAFVDILESEPGITQTKAYQLSHPGVSTNAAAVNASKLLRTTNVQIYRKKAVRLAKKTFVEIMSDKSVKPDTRLKAATDILDRNLGKAVTRTESHNTNLNLNADINESLGANFSEFLKQQTQL